MRRVEVGGLVTAYREAGRGPALVLLHGAMGDGREWRRQIASLSDAFRVVAWDAPGCGRSADPPAGWGLRDYADHLRAFIAALDLGRPHVAGLSFGGGLALALAAHHPEVPRSLAVVSGYAGWAGSLAPAEVARRLAGALATAELPPAAIGVDALPVLPPDAPADFVAELAEIMRDFHPAGLRVMARAFAAADLRGALPRIAVPTLIVHGDRDTRAPRAVADALHRGIPGSELLVVAGAGHMVNLEAPRRLEVELRRLISRAGGGGAEQPGA